jgi:hypothetical protein
MIVNPFKQCGQALWYAVVIIGCVIFFKLGAAVEKLKTQRELQSYDVRIDDARIDKWLPMPKTIFVEGTWRPMSQAHISISDHEAHASAHSEGDDKP